MKYIFLLIVCLINPIWGNPLPQDDSEFGDFDPNAPRSNTSEENSDPLGDIFGDILNGFGSLLNEGMKLITNVTDNDGDVSDAVAGAAKIGLDATQEVARIGIQAASAAPNILNQKLELAQGLGKTVSDTSGLVQQALREGADQAKVAQAFAKTYGEVAVENLLGFIDIFNKRLKCNTKCENMERGTTERQECEAKNCIEILVSRDPKDLEDEYDYSYGYDDEEDTSATV